VTTLPAPSSSTPATAAANPSMTMVVGLNNSGQMIGSQAPSGGYYTTGFLDSNGQFSPLPGTPMAINNNGQVAGVVGYVNGQMTDQSPYSLPNSTAHAYLDTNGTVKDLGANATVYALNDAGQATGSLNTGATITVGGGGPAPHVLSYDGQTSKDLGTLGGQFGYGYAINNHGDIVGQAETPTLALHAFLAQQAGKLIDLGTLPGDHDSSAVAINNKEQVVGYSGGNFLASHAFLYQNGRMTDLNKFLAPNSGVTLTDALAINNAGQILAVGNTTGDDWQRLYLLTPVGEPQPVSPNPLITPTPEPSTLALLAMASIGWAARRSARRRGAGTKVRC
jgi:probable HAF family extracellular repeat protein